MNYLLISICVALFACSTKDVVSESSIKNLSPESLTVKSIGDVDIHFTKYGNQSNAIIFIHGWSCDQSYWREQVDHFKKDYQVITVDLAGHGKSNAGNRSEWKIESFGHDVHNVAKQIKYDKLVLVGHSMGTAVALEASNLLKDNTAIVCVDYLKQPLIPAPREAVKGQLGAFYKDFGASTKFMVNAMFDETIDTELKQWIIDDMCAASSEEAIEMIIEMASNDYDDIFSGIKERNNRRYIINSDYKPTDNAHFGEELGFSINIIEDTGHFLMMEKPERFNEVLGKILTEI